VCTSGSDRT
jgi:large subunit ribosomal protein L13e